MFTFSRFVVTKLGTHFSHRIHIKYPLLQEMEKLKRRNHWRWQTGLFHS